MITLIDPQKTKACLDCIHVDAIPGEHPCVLCRNRYPSLFEPKPQKREFTADELIRIFKDNFTERRAIGILEIEDLIRSLYK